MTGQCQKLSSEENASINMHQTQIINVNPLKLTNAKCAQLNMTKEMAAKHYQLQNFDYALPQSWVDECLGKGFNPMPCCVWEYDSTPILGRPFALTQEAEAAIFDLNLWPAG